jgi:hypothetical protein
MIDYTNHRGLVVAAHSHGPVEGRKLQAPGRDRRRDKQHVTNVRRQQREAKRALESFFA